MPQQTAVIKISRRTNRIEFAPQGKIIIQTTPDNVSLLDTVLISPTGIKADFKVYHRLYNPQDLPEGQELLRGQLEISLSLKLAPDIELIDAIRVQREVLDAVGLTLWLEASREAIWNVLFMEDPRASGNRYPAYIRDYNDIFELLSTETSQLETVLEESRQNRLDVLQRHLSTHFAPPLGVTHPV